MSANTLAILLALLASSEWGMGAIFARLGMRHMGPRTATFLSLLAGALFTFAVALAMDATAYLRLPAGLILLFALLAVLQFVGGRFMNFTAIRLLGAGRATAIVGAVPLFAILLAVVFLGERLTLPLALGSLAVVAGIALIATEGAGRG